MQGLILAVWIRLAWLSGKLRKSAILAILALPAICSAQGTLMQLPPVTDSLGRPIAGATINVFTTTGNLSTGLVCASPVTVFQDAGLSIPFTTLTTDGNGNYPFFIQPLTNPYGFTVSGVGTSTSLCYGFSAPIPPGGSPGFTSVVLTEGTAPTCTAGADVLYADSSLHRPRFINNCGSAVSIALLTDNLSVFAAGGAIAPSTVNKVTITTPATGSTLTIANGKTLTASNSLTLAGTDGTTQTFPASPPTAGVIAYGVPSKQVFIATGTFTIPANVTAVKVTVVGGGAAGGGASVANTGAGGGSGGFAQKWLSGLTPGNTLAVTIGAGGTGVSNASGNNGGNSTVASGTQTIATITANGGTGGQASTDPGPGGGALISTGGDINGGGNPGLFVNTASGFGGGGGATFLGGAGGYVGSSTLGLAAVANTGSGGGGSGIGATNVGGAGAAGIVIFEWVQ